MKKGGLKALLLTKTTLTTHLEPEQAMLPCRSSFELSA